MNQFKNNLPDDEDQEYLGNIWGWKFSFISLGIIVALLLLVWYRSATKNKHTPYLDNQQITTEMDSLSGEDQKND